MPLCLISTAYQLQNERDKCREFEPVAPPSGVDAPFNYNDSLEIPVRF